MPAFCPDVEFESAYVSSPIHDTSPLKHKCSSELLPNICAFAHHFLADVSVLPSSRGRLGKSVIDGFSSLQLSAHHTEEKREGSVAMASSHCTCLNAGTYFALSFSWVSQGKYVQWPICGFRSRATAMPASPLKHLWSVKKTLSTVVTLVLLPKQT